MLGKSDDVGDLVSEMAIKIVDFDLIGPESGHDGGAARIAERELVVGAVEADSLGGETIDVGSFDNEISVTTERGG